ncbi:DnaJ domain-containing protein [Cryobacterium flavum]|uniref:J domain-containing protein n=1 Tax=Cryobacterium flavum TaxID=1424659 RepID=A0A4R8V3P5_9MICO|nr:J domain-containing protein [Cryobacterium flavum]TFB76109.1 J domain-containing protein [Cryobacterium flavum]SDO00143.1 DnaJ domain-containing protein [Cryobacterium flavum]
MDQTFYDVLNVGSDAPAAEIKQAYRRLIRAYHPDQAGDRGTEMTQRLNAANDVLRVPSRRAAYDRELAEASEPIVAEPEFVPSPYSDPVDVSVPRPASGTASGPARSPARYSELRRAWWAAAIGLVGAAVALLILPPSNWILLTFAVILAAAIVALRQRLTVWCVVILAVATVVWPLAAGDVLFFPAWLADAGSVSILAQSLLGPLALSVNRLRGALAVLRAARPNS